MNTDFLLVQKSILPESFPKIIEAREKIAHDNLSVSEACKECGIARSLYYKYKDKVFAPSGSLSKKVILSLKTEDYPGVLSSILLAISASKANILTISQDMPIHGLAYITLMINVKLMSEPLEDLIKAIALLDHVKKVEVLAYD
jgi:chorismate mutase